MLQNSNIYLNCDNEDNVSNVFIASYGEERKHRKASKPSRKQTSTKMQSNNLFTEIRFEECTVRSAKLHSY